MKREIQLASRSILAVVSFVWAASSAAQTYTVQIGAFREPASSFIAAASAHGEVVREANSKGLTLISVGRFGRRDAADKLLAQMARDYPGAYVRRVKRAGSTAAEPSRARPSAQPQSTTDFSVAELRSGSGSLLRGHKQDQDLFNQLSAEDRERVVSLDGELHVKVGERFVRLAEFVR